MLQSFTLLLRLAMEYSYYACCSNERQSKRTLWINLFTKISSFDNRTRMLRLQNCMIALKWMPKLYNNNYYYFYDAICVIHKILNVSCNVSELSDNLVATHNSGTIKYFDYESYIYRLHLFNVCCFNVQRSMFISTKMQYSERKLKQKIDCGDS